MGQKVNPIGFRLGVNKEWDSKWYSKENYADNLNKDIKIREYLMKTLKDASIASVLIERKKNRCDITINTARPGVIIGRGGEDIEKLSVDEINKVIEKEFQYDDYKWQKDNNIRITEKYRADGLHRCRH